MQPCYYKEDRGNKPYDLELMLQLHVLENLYILSDEGTVAEAADSRAFSDFVGRNPAIRYRTAIHRDDWTIYHVCIGKSDFDWLALPGGLNQCAV